MSKKSKIIITSALLVFTIFWAVNFVLAEDIGNPLGAANSDPRVVIGNVLKAILGIVGSLGLAIFVFGGFTWITSAGNDEKVKKGKDMITWAALGMVIIFISYALVTFIIGAISGVSGPEKGTGGTAAPENITGGGVSGGAH